MRVFVYRNLHKDKFSVRNVKTGRVVSRDSVVGVANATFVVGQKGRDRVIREQRKNVHAGIRGDWIDVELYGDSPESFREVTYNPYIAGHFFYKDTKLPIDKAEIVLLHHNRIFILRK